LKTRRGLLAWWVFASMPLGEFLLPGSHLILFVWLN
jgi:hypothetical protein